jgi:uracil DNA glycosylase
MFNLNQTWLPYLENEFEKDYMKDIKVFLEEEIKA